MRQQSLGENSGWCRNIHLNKIWKIALKNAAQDFAQDGTVPTEAKELRSRLEKFSNYDELWSARDQSHCR